MHTPSPDQEAAAPPSPQVRGRWLAWRRLYEAGRAAGGVVVSADAEAAGLDLRAFHRRVDREGWRHPFEGADVMLLPGVPDEPRSRVAAALRLLGERSAASHDTALWLHGLVGSAPDPVVITVPADRAPSSRPGLQVVRSRTLLASDITEVAGLRVTTVARSLRDGAAIRDRDAVLDVVTNAEQRRLVALEELAAEAHRPGTAAGTGVFRQVVRARTRDRWDSGLERDTATLCRTNGFVPHDGPYPVRCPDGRIVHLDVAFPAVRFGIECDGRGFHSDPKAFEVDRTRWRQLRLAGWTITWVTRRSLDTAPAAIIAEVAAAHHAAA